MLSLSSINNHLTTHFFFLSINKAVLVSVCNYACIESTEIFGHLKITGIRKFGTRGVGKPFETSFSELANNYQIDNMFLGFFSDSHQRFFIDLAECELLFFRF